MLRVLLIALPPIAFKLTKRFCLGLQHHDEALLHHGVETGIIRRLPSGEYVEDDIPLPPAKAAVLAKQIGYDPHHGHSVHGTNGHAELTAGTNGRGTNGHVDEAAEGIKRPVAIAAKVQSKLAAFWDEPRETVPDTQPHPED